MVRTAEDLGRATARETRNEPLTSSGGGLAGVVVLKMRWRRWKTVCISCLDDASGVSVGVVRDASWK